MNETGEAPCGRIIRSIDPLFRTRHFFLTHPVFPGELYQLTAMTRLYTDYCLTSSASPSNELVRLWSVVDLLFNDSLAFMDARNFSRHVSFCLVHWTKQRNGNSFPSLRLLSIIIGGTAFCSAAAQAISPIPIYTYAYAFLRNVVCLWSATFVHMVRIT